MWFVITKYNRKRSYSMKHLQVGTYIGGVFCILVFTSILGCVPNSPQIDGALTFLGKAAGIFGCRGNQPVEVSEIAAALNEDFDGADIDNDGWLSMEEAQAVVPELTEAIFAAIDINSDGFLDQEEVHRAETSGEPSEGESAEGESAEGEVTEGESAEGETAEGEMGEGEAEEGETEGESEGEEEGEGEVGTIDNPYILYTIEDVQAIGADEDSLSAHYRLGNNIDAGDTKNWNGGAGFIPIGQSDMPFEGTFDGAGYHISNLHIHTSGMRSTGLFAYAEGRDEFIQNLGLENCDIASSCSGHDIAYVGGLVGSNSAPLSNCFVTGVISAVVTGDYTDIYVGGLVGRNGATLNNCYVTAAVSVEVIDDNGRVKVGGLAGYNVPDISDCYTTGAVTSPKISGGLVGDNYGGMISNCYTMGAVAGALAGGLLGSNSGSSHTVSDCHATGNVTAVETGGGLIGYSNGDTINDCYATGMVTAGYRAGGLVGSNGSTITHCHAEGDVVVTGDADEDVFSGGGLVAENAQYGNSNISDCYAVGNVTVAGSGSMLPAGGLVGWLASGNEVTNSYAEGDVSASGSGEIQVGGLVGPNSNGTISVCYATGDVSASTTGGSTAYAGGLVAKNSNFGLVEYSYAMGAVLAESVDTHSAVAGGLVGKNFDYAHVERCCATGTVNATAENSATVGGLAGSNQDAIIDCYAMGAVSATGKSVYAGGFVGANSWYSCVIRKCYAAGTLTASAVETVHAGGFAGSNSNEISDCFWDTTTSGWSESEGGTGLPTTEMMQENTFTAASWDFVDTWAITEGETYPWLQGLDYSLTGYPAP